VPVRDQIQSAVLVGRDDFLSLASRRLTEVAAGAGQLLFVAGEAGIGKTRLLGSIARQARDGGFSVVRGAAFPGDVQSSAGLLLHLAADLRSADDGHLQQLGHHLSARLRAISSASGSGAGPPVPGEPVPSDQPQADPVVGDAHHRRRLLVQDLVDLVLTSRPDRPTLMILEDLHWADQLSLDVLGHLAGGLAGRPLLLAGAYRSDELTVQLPIRDLRLRLLSQRLAEEIRLPRLGEEQTAAMTASLLGRPIPALVVRAIHERSDGIPLHVEELLAAIDENALTEQSVAVVQAAAVPDTLGDAVLGRAQTLPRSVREVASAAAVIGRSFDFDLLTAVTQADPGEIAAALRQLKEAHLVLPGSDEVTFDFRHALIRDTLYADTDLPIRRRLHERVARNATERGYPSAYVSAHLELARLGPLAYQHAITAADQAASISAHREALELYRRAVRNQPDDLPASDRARLLTALADAAAAGDDNLAAAAAYESAHELVTVAGDARAAASLVPRMVAVAHLLGEGLDGRVARLQAAVDSLAGVAGADQERARLHAAMAAAYMLDRRLDEALDLGELSRIEIQRVDDGEAAVNNATTHGSVLVFAGRMGEGWKLLEDSIATARRCNQEAEAARGYRMLASSASVLVEYDRAEQWLEDGIRYAERVELWNHRHYLAAHLAHVQWATGQWDVATGSAQHALADGRGGITTWITAQYVLGYLAMGRGEWDLAGGLLREALVAGERMAELQRLSPPLWGLAEVARCRGDDDRAIELCERGYRASADVKDAAYLFPYLLTGVRAHLARGDVESAEAWSDRVGAVLTARAIPGALPAVEHGRGLVLLARGDTAAAHRSLTMAAQAWGDRRRFWEGMWAGLDLAAVAAKARRRGEANRAVAGVRAAAGTAGATALVVAADQVSGSVDRHRQSEPWYPLSAREFEVAGLVAAGLTNRQIAERLVLAPKTISAHIEHILAKLGAARRTEIAAWCANVSR
jgi:DNA-binding CsgD family transcriptional regulator/tetratricopeptide (TPR) repeat protein